MPRITGGSLAEHRAQIHHRVFTAFAELLAERSFDAITMAQIAAERMPERQNITVGASSSSNCAIAAT